MDEKSQDIDWDRLSGTERTEAIKALYRAVSGMAQVQGVAIATFIDTMLNPTVETSQDYSNFRNGRIPVARAKLMHRYLEEHHFDQVHVLEPELFPMNPHRAFDLFIDGHLVEGGLRIVPLEREFGLVQRARDVKKHLQTLRLGQEFGLELTSPHVGTCVAFQGYKGRWHSFPLDESKRYFRIGIKGGAQLIPRTGNGDPIPLCEEHWTGPNSFVVVTSKTRTLPHEPRRLVRLTDDESLRVYRADIRFAVNDEPQR